METIRKIFDFTFYQVNDFKLSIFNIVALVLLFFAVKLIIRWYRKFLSRAISASSWINEDKEHNLLILGRYVIYIIAIVIALNLLGIKDLLSGLLEYKLIKVKEFKLTIWNLIVIAFIIFAARILLRIVRLFLKRAIAVRQIDKGKEYTILKLAEYFLYLIAFVFALDSVGISLAVILGAGAALLVGVGFGLQNIFNDIVSGFVLLFEGTFKVGDVIEIDTMVARVVQLDIRTSKVETRDGNVIIVPNSKLTSNNIINWSHGSPLTRFNIKVGVAYGSDTERVKTILHDCVKTHPYVNKTKDVLVMFNDFGDSALLFEVYFWALKKWEIPIIQSDLRFTIDKAFRENDIRIPFPQRDLHLMTDQTKQPNQA